MSFKRMSQEELIKHVVEICNVDDKTARSYLQLFNWNLNDAVENLLNTHNDSGDDDMSTSHNCTVSASNSTSTVQPNPARTSSTNIATLSSLAGQSPKDPNSNDEGGQAFYVGGAEHGGGGQQVLGPPRDANPGEFVREIFHAARDGGAEALETARVADLNESDIREPEAFIGTGHRLGESLSDPPVRVAGKSSTSLGPTNSDSENKPIVIKMWQDGFSLDDGPLRPYFDPASLAFLNAIKQGRIPPELIGATGNSEVQTLLEDHHNETFQAPSPPKVVVFSGTGHVLGNPTPRIVEAESVSPTFAIPSPPVDLAGPITQIHVRLPDGSRLLVKLNHEHTIQDLRSAIISQRPELASQAFSLLTTFPRTELVDTCVSLATANLLNAAVIVNTKP